MSNPLAINLDFAGVDVAPPYYAVNMDFVPPPDPVDFVNGGKAYMRFGGENAVCLRSLTVSTNHILPDTTDSCSNGWRELPTVPTIWAIDYAVEGITKNSDIRGLSLGGSIYIEDVQLVYPPMDGNYFGDVVICNMLLSEYSENITFDGVTTFSAKLQSVGTCYYFPEVASTAAYILDNPDLADLLSDIYG